MLTRDTYIALLEKRAAEDTHEALSRSYDAEVADGRQVLTGLFSEAPETQKQQTSQIKKLFPGDRKSVDTVPGNPLMKVARYAMMQTELLKTASSAYMEVTLSSFADELEKISAVNIGAKGKLPTIRPPQKTYSIGNTTSKAPGAWAQGAIDPKAAVRWSGASLPTPPQSSLGSKLRSAFTRS